MDCIVGVHVAVGTHGRLSKTVQGTGVKMSIQSPLQGSPDVHIIVGVQCQDVTPVIATLQGRSSPMTHGRVYFGGGGVVEGQYGGVYGGGVVGEGEDEGLCAHASIGRAKAISILIIVDN